MSDAEINKIDNTNLSAELLREFIKERRRDRFWRNIRFLAGFLFLLMLVVLMVGKSHPEVTGSGESDNYVSLIRLEGMIGPGQGFSAETVVPILNDAFKDKDAKGVILDINSGGGTPVQATIIHDEILKLKKRYKKRVIVVGEDTLASGAYLVAVSADKIYVNPNTVTGSIGVIMEGFGFVDVMKKVGVDRRVFAAGANKDRLDPFLPTDKADIDKIHSVLDEVHNNFSQIVIDGRKGKLQGEPKDIFTGDFWTGQSALKLGLVDALGNLSDAMQNEFKVSKVRDYSEAKNPFRALFGSLGTFFNLPVNETHLKFQAKI